MNLESNCDEQEDDKKKKTTETDDSRDKKMWGCDGLLFDEGIT